MTSGIFNDVAKFEQCLGLPKGFYDALLKEDDWSFVVKLSALFEAACTHILVKRLDAPELKDSIAELDHGNSKYGKITLLKKLGAISTEQSTVLRTLATLRNDLVHDVKNVEFSFGEYVALRNPQQTDNLVKSFGHGVMETIPFGNRTIQRREFVLNNPKLALWLTSAEVLACLYLEIKVAQLQLQGRALEEYANLTIRSSGSAKATLLPPAEL